MAKTEKVRALGKDGCKTDFYVIIDYKKLRGVRCITMDDADGDNEYCLVIPMLKNGIKNYGRQKWRVILAARQSHYEENASHVLVPQVEDAVQRAMVACGFFDRYGHTAPVVGEVVPDITKIFMPPVFSKNSTSYIDMEANRIDKSDGGSTPSDIVDIEPRDRKFLSDAQKRMREMLLKRQKEKKDG